MIQINIRQQGAEVSALRSAFYAFLEYAIIHYSTFKERFYERKNSAVCDLFTNKIHHYLMVNMVEESLNIGIHCPVAVSYTHLRAHETRHDLVCRLLLEKKKKKKKK